MNTENQEAKKEVMAIFYKAGEVKDMKPATPKDGKAFTLEELQFFVGGNIEILKMSPKHSMVFNEEGRLLGLPVNRRASELVQSAYPGRPTVEILGDVLVCKNEVLKKDEDEGRKVPQNLSPGELLTNLAGFTGTDHYYRLSQMKDVVFTDGMAYLAEAGKCHWLMDLIAINLKMVIEKKFPDEYFTSITFKRTEGNRAVVKIEDGNGNNLYRQNIPFTDLEIPEIKFFGSNDGEKWVIMLPSEY